MIKKQRGLTLLFNYKFIFLVSILVLVIVLNLKHKNNSIERKLIGDWNVEVENSYDKRYSEYNSLGIIINIKGDGSIQLPPLNSNKSLEEAERDANGKWEIISNDPDSISIDAPNNPFNGKYSIRFFIDLNGYQGMRNNIYKIELKNKTTLLIFNKGGVFVKIPNWDS